MLIESIALIYTYRRGIAKIFVDIKVSLKHRFHQIVMFCMIAQADRRQLQWITRQNDLTGIWIHACERNHCFTFAALSSLIEEDMRKIFIAEFTGTTNKNHL